VKMITGNRKVSSRPSRVVKTTCGPAVEQLVVSRLRPTLICYNPACSLCLLPCLLLAKKWRCFLSLMSFKQKQMEQQKAIQVKRYLSHLGSSSSSSSRCQRRVERHRHQRHLGNQRRNRMKTTTPTQRSRSWLCPNLQLRRRHRFMMN